MSRLLRLYPIQNLLITVYVHVPLPRFICQSVHLCALLCQAKIQYMLTWKVFNYSLLYLPGSISWLVYWIMVIIPVFADQRNSVFSIPVHYSLPRLMRSIIYHSFPSKHKTFVYYLYNVSPTLVQHCTNIIQIFCVYWVVVRTSVHYSFFSHYCRCETPC